MKLNWFKLAPYLVILILIGMLFFKGCGSAAPETFTVKVPEVSGEFKPEAPKYDPVPEIPYVIQWKDRTIKIPNPVNDSLLNAYTAAMAENDSLKQLLLYVDAIQLRTFTNTFEDDYLNLSIKGQVQGYLQYLKPEYTIKERSLEVESPETALRILAGFEFGANKQLTDFPIKLNLGMQNAKGNIFKASYMRLQGQDYYLGGYDFSILNIRK